MKRTQIVNKSKANSKTKMRIYKGSEARTIAVKNGWILERTSGSHFIYKKPGSCKILTISNKLNRIVWERLVKEYELDLNL